MLLSSSISCSRIRRLLICTRDNINRRTSSGHRNATTTTTTIFDFVNNGKLVEIPIENIRNFSVIAHVDHGIYIILYQMI